MDNNDMGRKLFTSWVEPPLWIGTTFDIFKISGKIPELKDRLIM